MDGARPAATAFSACLAADRTAQLERHFLIQQPPDPLDTEVNAFWPVMVWTAKTFERSRSKHCDSDSGAPTSHALEWHRMGHSRYLTQRRRAFPVRERLSLNAITLLWRDGAGS